MTANEIIHKKREGLELDEEEIRFFIEGYVSGEIPDYQVSAFLMAVFFKGMTSQETATFTMHMARSGDMVDLAEIDGVKVDKHSTGGVGDKTSLIALPIAAACGVTIAKMSGRGLGHTGGTVDKLESIPGFKTEVSREEFFETVKRTGISIIGQSGNICPADKKLYALRDVTSTVDSIPLIASSIMSKKIAAGADKILLDVKTGSGAFMKSYEDSVKLAEEMVEIGRNTGRETVALITDMDAPLGKNIGNALEIIEVVETLKGRGPKDLQDICITIAANMICLAGKAKSLEEAEESAKAVIKNGEALKKLGEMVEAQQGDAEYITGGKKLSLSPVKYAVVSQRDGYINSIDTEKCGLAAMALGAGRENKDSIIDHGAGIVLHHTVGDYMNRGDVIAVFYAETEEKCREAEKIFMPAIKMDYEKTAKRKVILETVH